MGDLALALFESKEPSITDKKAAHKNVWRFFEEYRNRKHPPRAPNTIQARKCGVIGLEIVRAFPRNKC
jgi:hypothetical protein